MSEYCPETSAPSSPIYMVSLPKILLKHTLLLLNFTPSGVHIAFQAFCCTLYSLRSPTRPYLAFCYSLLHTEPHPAMSGRSLRTQPHWSCSPPSIPPSMLVFFSFLWVSPSSVLSALQSFLAFLACISHSNFPFSMPALFLPSSILLPCLLIFSDCRPRGKNAARR